jgi:small nuclear ribonucleoprotein (snRNP)-like protein
MGRKQTLNVFVQALEGSRVVVELRSDTIIRGLLQQVRRCSEMR